MRSLLSSPLLLLSALFFAASPSIAYPHDDSLVNWNINVNPDAGASVLNYDSERGSGRNTTYKPSPDNWRALPFYNILLDKFAVRLLRLLFCLSSTFLPMGWFGGSRGPSAREGGRFQRGGLLADRAKPYPSLFLFNRTETLATMTSSRPRWSRILCSSTSGTEETSRV
jgi:hypothetical protein